MNGYSNLSSLITVSDGKLMGIPSVNSPAVERESAIKNFTDSSFNFGNDQSQNSFSFLKKIINVPDSKNESTSIPATSPHNHSNTQVTSIVPPTAQTSTSDLSTSSSLNDLSSTTPATTNGGTQGNQELVPVPNGQHFVDITEYLNMPQKQAAKKLGIPTSTLSKRWKEACRARKWPYRNVSKLDREITTLLHNLPQGQTSWPADVEETLGFLLRKRQEELRPVVIRI